MCSEEKISDVQDYEMKPNCCIICLLGIVFLYSCSTPRYIYSPAAPNIAYFKQKGDSKLSAFYSEGNNYYGENTSNTLNKGLDIQAAYALSNNWYVTSDFYKRSERECYNSSYNIFDTSTVNYLRTIISFGGGCYIPLNTKKTVTFYTQLSIGFGKFMIHDYGKLNAANYDREHINNIIKYSFQGGFNFMPSPSVKFSLTGNFALVHYGRNKSNYSNGELLQFYLDNINRSNILFYEPTFNLQIGVPGLKWLKVEASSTFCRNITTEYNYYRTFNSSVGLTADINMLFKKKN